MGLDVQSLASALAGPFSFQVSTGQCLAISGPSGSGKSLLMRMLADLDPSEGRVLLDGEDRTAMPATQWRQRVSLVPARSGWWSEKVDDHFDPAQANERSLLSKELFLPDSLFLRSIDEASTGERQRLAIIRALLTRPRVLLLDEPTASLDPVTTRAVEALVRRRLQAGMILVLVTHDAAQAERIADMKLHMHDRALVPA